MFVFDSLYFSIFFVYTYTFLFRFSIIWLVFVFCVVLFKTHFVSFLCFHFFSIVILTVERVFFVFVSQCLNCV